MTWVSLAISIIAIGMTFFFRGKNDNVLKALKESKDNEESLVKTLAEIIDDEGVVRGQLMLPGQVQTSDAVRSLREANKEINELLYTTRSLRTEIQQNKDNQKSIESIVEFINKEETWGIQIRLPGQKIQPNKTPCGSKCKHSYWYKEDSSPSWRCSFDQGRVVDKARPKFLDAQNQCIHWELDPE